MRCCFERVSWIATLSSVSASKGLVLPTVIVGSVTGQLGFPRGRKVQSARINSNSSVLQR